MIKLKVINFLRKVSREEKIEVFPSENDKFGHYSTNIAFKIAKAKGTNPIKTAEEIINGLKSISGDFFDKIEIAGPGFINFWLSENVLREEIKEILKNKEKYGKPKKLKKEKIQIEFISANPTGPLTLANGRGGFMGDVLSNILEFNGNKIEREYYVNDTGNQIMTLGKSIAAVLGFINREENFYKGEYVKKWANKNKLKVKKFKDNPLNIGKLAAKNFLNSIKEVLTKDARIKFDRWTSEDKDIHKKSFIKKVFDLFDNKNLTYKKDGAVWLKTTDFGDDKDRVLITKDGFPTYFLADSGHFLETKKRGFDKKIIILGPDHYGYVKRIQAAAEIIGLKKLDVIITQAVRLMSKGSEVKMSKRSGEFITFEDLIKEVKLEAARLFFLMHSSNTHMDFDLDLAKEQSMKNPVYYIQYAGVRIYGILNKLKNKKFRMKVDFSLLDTESDLNLIKILIRFPEIIEEAAENYNPAILARYAIDLSRVLHNFYEKERVVGEREELVLARMKLLEAAQVVFKNTFNLLGISMPKKM